jgi:acyl carrier protein phosphodiesterase
MESRDWLSNYRNLRGAHQSLEGLVRRSAYMEQSRDAVRILDLHYHALREYYRQFWAEAREYALTQYQLLQSP